LQRSSGPTRETYDPLQLAYETLNRALFENSLPNALITLQRRRGTYSYFVGDRFARPDGAVTGEIALNPSHFRNRPVAEVLATLAHEMVHLSQHHFGKLGRGRYHNMEWAEKMKAIGLQPSSTGKEGGEEVGDVMDHIIVADGGFDRTVKKMMAKGFVLSWTEQPEKSLDALREANGESRSGQRVRYVCPHGDMKAWAKHEAKLVCGEHMEPMVVDQPTPRGYVDITASAMKTPLKGFSPRPKAGAFFVRTAIMRHGPRSAARARSCDSACVILAAGAVSRTLFEAGIHRPYKHLELPVPVDNVIGPNSRRDSALPSPSRFSKPGQHPPAFPPAGRALSRG
jgi:hypothetical protein